MKFLNGEGKQNKKIINDKNKSPLTVYSILNDNKSKSADPFLRDLNVKESKKGLVPWSDPRDSSACSDDPEAGCHSGSMRCC